MNCHKAREQGKAFHYSWFLLSILLIVRELLEDNQFANLDGELPEAVKYASLWPTKDSKCICDTKIFQLLMDMNI